MGGPDTTRIRIADVALQPMTPGSTVDWIAARAARSSGGTVCTPNADHVVRAHRDPAFAAVLDSLDLRVPDGMAIIYSSRLAGMALPATVTGRLLLPSVAERAAVEGWPIALFGAAPGVAQEASRRLRDRYPGLEVAASITPPMPLVIGSPADKALIGELAASGARVVFVALGAPKQEQWIQAHASDLPSSVLVGVGAALDIVSGRFRAAPAWMTRIGVEWMFRLAQEPRRLARRYLVDDPWIFWWAIGARRKGAPGNSAGRPESRERP